MSRYHAKKRLGQNFLKSSTIIHRLIELIDPQPRQRIIEIGPGRGAITNALAESGAQVTAVEYDRDLIPYLTVLLENFRNVNLVQGDFLTYEPDFSGFKLVGNLPYNLSSPVIDWTVRHHGSLVAAYFMLQKEVANRLASSAGSKDWSPLAIFTQLHFTVRVCFDVSPQHFSPPPKVTSSVVSLIPKQSPLIKSYDRFERVVRQAFSQRRKTLLNNLVPSLVSETSVLTEVLEALQLDSRIRAEQITTEMFLELTNQLMARKILT